MNEKFNKLMEDEAFVDKLLAMETDKDIQAFLAENDVELSLEEIAAIKKGVEVRLSESEELSDDMLENVAGGSDVSDLITAVVDAVCSFGDSIHKWTRGRW